jgi:hypothetical protein
VGQQIVRALLAAGSVLAGASAQADECDALAAGIVIASGLKIESRSEDTRGGAGPIVWFIPLGGVFADLLCRPQGPRLNFRVHTTGVPGHPLLDTMARAASVVSRRKPDQIETALAACVIDSRRYDGAIATTDIGKGYIECSASDGQFYATLSSGPQGRF